MRVRRLILAAVALASLAATPPKEFQFNGDSMLPTVHAADRLKIIRDWDRYPTLKRGQLIVYHNERSGDELWLKRVVGVPGDRVRMRAGRLELNGKPVDRQSLGRCVLGGADGTPVIGACYHESLPDADPAAAADRILIINGGLGQLDESELVVVPEGYVYVLGDNRRASIDSRLPAEHGLVPLGAIVGRWLRDAPNLGANPGTNPGPKPPKPKS